MSGFLSFYHKAHHGFSKENKKRDEEDALRSQLMWRRKLLTSTHQRCSLAGLLPFGTDVLGVTSKSSSDGELLSGGLFKSQNVSQRVVDPTSLHS